VERVLELAKKVADEAEVFLASVTETPVGFEANRLKRLETRESISLSLRIIKGGRVGFAATTKLSDPQTLVQMAVDTARFGVEARFTLPSQQAYPQVEVYDPEVETFPIEDMVELGNSLMAKVRAHTPELLCDAWLTKSVGRVRILNSRGGEASYRKSFFTIGMVGNLIRGTDMLFVGEMDSSCRPITDLTNLSDAVIQQIELARNTASVSSGQLPVVFTAHGVRSAFFTPLALAFNGRVVVQGASPLVGNEGKQLFDKRLSLWDDATVDYRPASRLCDDEGVPSQKTALIEKGVVTNFLYDLQTAALAGARSTGSGDRAHGGMPSPSVSALIIEQGDTPFEDMIRDMKEGLVVEQLIGAEQGNVLGGEFSGNVLLGYKVERGEIVGRVKDTMVSGNIYHALNELNAIGHEARWVGGILRTPAIYCSRLAVASKG